MTRVLDTDYRLAGICAVGLLLMVQFADAFAETIISLLIGQAWTYDSDVRLQEPGGTDLVFTDVSWDTNPFEMPPYYAIRLTHWLDRSPDWGVAVDFTHAKMYSHLEQVVQVSGSERLGGTFNKLESRCQKWMRPLVLERT